MKQMIHNLRQQPEEVRRHILHILTVIVGIALVFLWIYSLGVNFSNTDTQARIGQDLKPISAIKNNLVGGYNNAVDTNSDAYLRAQENNL